MSKKPLPRKKRVVNRGYQYSRKKEDRVKNISVTLKDIDSAVIYYIENVIQPSVKLHLFERQVYHKCFV